MSVRNLHKKRCPVIHLDRTYKIRVVPPELFRQKHDPDLLIGEYLFKLRLQFLPFMHDNPFYASKPHTRVSVHIITNQIHPHTNYPRIENEIKSP